MYVFELSAPLTVMLLEVCADAASDQLAPPSELYVMWYLVAPLGEFQEAVRVPSLRVTFTDVGESGGGGGGGGGGGLRRGRHDPDQRSSRKQCHCQYERRRKSASLSDLLQGSHAGPPTAGSRSLNS